MVPVIDANTTVIQTLPFAKRKPKWIIFMQSFCFASKWLYNNVLTGYMGGTIADSYSQIILYTLGQQVIYNYGVWESLVSGNTGNTPDASPLQWMKVNDSFIGATERAHYTCNRIVFEWALNRYFQQQLTSNGFIGFRQPDDPISPTRSDIYINNVAPVYPTFIVAPDEADSDNISPVGSSGWVTPDEEFTAATSYLFSINIPAAVYGAIGADGPTADSIIGQFVNSYAAAGTRFEIVTY